MGGKKKAERVKAEQGRAEQMMMSIDPALVPVQSGAKEKKVTLFFDLFSLLLIFFSSFSCRLVYIA